MKQLTELWIHQLSIKLTSETLHMLLRLQGSWKR